jgi:hypothetical protein
MSFLQGPLGPPDVEKMNKKKLWKLMAMLGLAVTSLLLLFLLLGQITVGAAPGENVTIADVRSASASFTASGTATSEATGLNFCVCSRVWVSETVDSAGDVGLSTSLALEPTYPYTPHISYRKIITDQDYDLKYAYLSGTTWFSQTVDSGGDWTSLALVPTYPFTPCIAYDDKASPNFWEWFLRYTCRDGTTWTIITLSSYMRAGYPDLAMEPTYPFTPHISYYNPWGTIATLHHVYLSGTVWMSGTWVNERVEPSLSGVGWWGSLALEPTYPYTPHISYYDYTNDDLKHAWLSGTIWLSETVDSVGDVGWYTSLALDSSGNPHISYLDNTNDALKYAWWNGTTWLSETVDSTGQPSWGRGTTSLELDQADMPYISYYDAISDDLKLAHFDGTVWFIQTVDSGGDVGQYSSLALDPVGCPHISYYDATNGDLKYAYLPLVCKIYLPIITKNH